MKLTLRRILNILSRNFGEVLRANVHLIETPQNTKCCYISYYSVQYSVTVARSLENNSFKA